MKKNPTWVRMNSVPGIIGGVMSPVTNVEGKADPGATRLQRIIITESAALIWRLRNKRVIDETPQNKWPSDAEIHNMWLRTINERITLDAHMTNKKYKNKALRTETVLRTWEKNSSERKRPP